MGKVVATKSALNYAYQNASFALFCYETEELMELLLEPWFIMRLTELTSRPAAQKKYMQECLLACSAEDDNCPFILSNLTFPHFSNFLSIRTRSRGKTKGSSLGVSSYDQAKSALVHLYRMSKYDMSSDFADNLKMFMKGMKRTVAAKKMENGDSGIVGKKKMDFKVYEKICELFLKEEGEEFLFARCFLVLEWNLMSRSDNIVHAHLFHITWEDDCLAFRFAKSKTDQTGRNSDQVWHVYATPDKPATCPVLGLATYVFANPGLTNVEKFTETDEEGNPSGRLFPGGDQYGRFMDCLRRIIANNADEFLHLGIRPGDLGSHSARKGACSYASAGSTVSPPMVSICLRAMWSMGSVKERYLQFKKAGDQYLGRVVCGLDVNDVSFAVSPPYFECDGDVKAKILTLLKDFTVGGHGIGGEIFQMLYFCFASLCYHFEFLVKRLSKRNKLQASPFFTHIPLYAREAATVRMPWNKTANTPVFTGMPPHVSILTQIEELKIALKTSTEAILNGVKEDLDGRRLGTESYFAKEEIVAEIKSMRADMTERMNHIARSSSSFALQAPYDVQPEIAVGGFEEDEPAVTLRDQTGHRFQYFVSAGGIRRLPEDFLFPKMTMVTCMTSWFSGNESMRTVPYKLLKATEIVCKKERYKLAQMKILMNGVEIAAKRVGTWERYARNGSWEPWSAVRLFETIHHFFDYPSKITKRRTAQISWQTVFNLYKKNGKIFATDIE